MKNSPDGNALADLRTRLDEIVPTLEEAAREAAALLQQGNLGRGLTGLRDILEALYCFHEGLEVLSLSNGNDFEGLTDLKGKLEQVYPSLYSAIEAEDTVSLADVLEYELAHTFADYNSDKVD